MGLTPPPCPRVNAGRLIPNEALRRRNAVCLFCGAARPTPPATWDVASQIAPCGAGKSNRKRKRNNAFSSVMPVFLFIIASALREAHDGSGPTTAGAWGRHQPPHESIRRLLSKIISTEFMPGRASFGIKRPAFTWGCGGGVSPRKCVRKSRFWAT